MPLRLSINFKISSFLSDDVPVALRRTSHRWGNTDRAIVFTLTLTDTRIWIRNLYLIKNERKTDDEIVT